MIPEAGQPRENLFLAMFLDGGEHCFLAIFPVYGKNQETCFHTKTTFGKKTTFQNFYGNILASLRIQVYPRL
jgi:hypothetical protein